MTTALEFTTHVGNTTPFFAPRAKGQRKPTAKLVAPGVEAPLEVDDAGDRWVVTPARWSTEGKVSIVWSSGEVYEITVLPENPARVERNKKES